MPKKEKALTEEEVTTEPTTTAVVNDVLSSFNKDVINSLRACIDSNQCSLLIGETGTGKTTLINELAKEKKRELIRVSLNGATSTDDILGKFLAKDGSTYWQDGVLVSAMKNGHWIVFDEINAALPEVLFALHSLLDDDRKVTLTEKNGEVIRPVESFRFFACMNPSEDYAGTKEMNTALISRFAGVFHIGVFPPEEEKKVLIRKGIAEDTASRLIGVGNYLREKREKGDIFTFISTRDLIQAGLLIMKGISVQDGVTFSIFGKLNRDEREDLIKDTKFKEYINTTKYKSEEVLRLEKELVARDDTIARYNEDIKGYAQKITDLNKGIKTLEDTHAGFSGYELTDPSKLAVLEKLNVLKKKTT